MKKEEICIDIKLKNIVSIFVYGILHIYSVISELNRRKSDKADSSIRILKLNSQRFQYIMKRILFLQQFEDADEIESVVCHPNFEYYTSGIQLDDARQLSSVSHSSQRIERETTRLVDRQFQDVQMTC